MDKVSPPCGRWLPLVAGCLLAVLSACSSPFALSVVAPRPDEVASVFVLFGEDADFDVDQGTGEIATLVRAGALEDYLGFAQFELVSADGELEWRALNQQLKALGVSWSAPDQRLRLRLPRSRLESNPTLAIAVVARTGRQYRFHRWRHAELLASEEELAITVTGDSVTGSF